MRGFSEGPWPSPTFPVQLPAHPQLVERIANPRDALRRPEHRVQLKQTEAPRRSVDRQRTRRALAPHHVAEPRPQGRLPPAPQSGRPPSRRAASPGLPHPLDELACSAHVLVPVHSPPLGSCHPPGASCGPVGLGGAVHAERHHSEGERGSSTVPFAPGGNGTVALLEGVGHDGRRGGDWRGRSGGLTRWAG